MSRFCIPTIALSFLGWSVACAPPAISAELLMFEQDGCPYCRKFDVEIAPNYAESRAAQLAPLRRVDIFDDRRGGYRDIEPVVFTPTFVMIDDAGKEIGRLQGYPGEKYFYSEIDPMLQRLEKNETPSNDGAIQDQETVLN